MDGGWSLEELAERVGQALAADGVRAPNGRVRDVPDARAIRWYATIGLVDRPHSGHRRAGRYTARHLLQVVAVKRRQAQGRSLAEIQAELAGATDATLRAVARVPDELLAGAPPDRPPAVRPRFWAEPPESPEIPPARQPNAAPARPDRPAASRAAAGPTTVRYLVPLAGGVTLSLPAAPTAGDLAAIRAAAAPLLDLLADRGLAPRPANPGRVVRTKEPEDDDHSAH
jgi:DNA-binding transcriptional MerR regulator